MTEEQRLRKQVLSLRMKLSQIHADKMVGGNARVGCYALPVYANDCMDAGIETKGGFRSGPLVDPDFKLDKVDD